MWRISRLRLVSPKQYSDLWEKTQSSPKTVGYHPNLTTRNTFSTKTFKGLQKLLHLLRISFPSLMVAIAKKILWQGKSSLWPMLQQVLVGSLVLFYFSLDLLPTFIQNLCSMKAFSKKCINTTFIEDFQKENIKCSKKAILKKN